MFAFALLYIYKRMYSGCNNKVELKRIRVYVCVCVCISYILLIQFLNKSQHTKWLCLMICLLNSEASIHVTIKAIFMLSLYLYFESDIVKRKKTPKEKK